VPGHLAYAASKAAMASMTRSLAIEWARDGIRLVDVAPGYVATDLNAEFFADAAAQEKLARRIPVGRVGRAEEVGRLVAALFELEVGFLTGTTVYIDGAHGITL
jgi:NAD(P)-dependent dehydrogenase (short-subunit alcohol dehydrogenase family)